MPKLFLIICCLVCVIGITAQDKNTDHKKCEKNSWLFVGTIIDTDDGTISDATIEVRANSQKNKLSKLHSDRKGQFKICLPAGTYDFFISAKGFKNLNLQGYQLDNATKAKFEFKLVPGQCNDCGEWFPPSNLNQ